MGITYQTNNRQRRKVMTAPLNAPPEALRTGTGALVELPAPAPAAAGRGKGLVIGLAVGVALAVAAVQYLL